MTGTEGVDQYALNYVDYCTGENSAVQQTADVIGALGIDAKSENPFLPNAAILRSAEAVDSVLNAASSGASDVPNSMNAGRILCSIAPNAALTLIGTLLLLLPPPTLTARRALGHAGPAGRAHLLYAAGHHRARAHQLLAIGQFRVPGPLRRLRGVHRGR